MDLWKQTTQFRHWTLTAEQLQETRIANHRRSLENLKKSRSAADAPEILDNLEVEQLVADSTLILEYYTQKIKDYATFFALPYNVLATAIVIFKRFYLHYTLMDYKPPIIVPTVILLATKVENTHLSLRRIVEATKMQEEEIRDCEYVLCQGTMFDFAIHHPYICLHALFLEMQKAALEATSTTLDSLARVYELSIKIVTDGYLSDLIFIHTPAQIALAAFRLAWIETVGPDDLPVLLTGYDDTVPVTDIMEDLKRWRGYSVDMKQVKSVNKKYSTVFK